MMYTSLLIALSPLLIAWLKTDDWAKTRTALVAVGVALILYTLGRELDGALAWPLPAAFWPGFLQAILGQQALYLLIKDTPFVLWLEAVGQKQPPLTWPGDQL